jgi:hypothetical protein
VIARTIVAVALLNVAGGCGSTTGLPERDSGACPPWMISTDAAAPIGPCRLPGDTVNVPDGMCHPAACQSYADLAMSERAAGNGDLLCAGACMRRCAGDPAGEQLNLAEAWQVYGQRCSY